MSAKILFHIYLWLFRIIGLLPAWFLYRVLSPFICFLLYRVAHYRVDVVRKNLAECFTEKDKEQLRDIERKFYRHLGDVMVDTIDLIGISRKQIVKRIVFAGNEEHLKETEGKNWIAMLGHYGSWEYFVAYPLFTNTQTVTVYTPLHDRAFDLLYKYMRTRFGLIAVPQHELLRAMVANQRVTDKNFSYGMVADQSPPRRDPPHWFDFLGRPTAFYTGAEKVALKFMMPVYYVHSEKHSPCRHVVRFELIYDGEERVAPEEITARYIRKLEEQIKDHPELWMWSHKRWKHTYNDV